MPDRRDLLAFANTLADAADEVSRRHFRSEDLRRTHKGDGTPVAEVDLAVEEAMLALVRSRRPGDAVIGEEVGPHDGTTGVRWIFDGIDGTHNFAEGRPGWGTIVGAEVDGEVVVGMVSAPAWGRRYWATPGDGAWSTPYGGDGGVDAGAAQQLHCRPLDPATEPAVVITPWKGFLVGWRSDATVLHTPPVTPRSQCFALDAVMVAEGQLDATVILLGGIWDVAATQLIVREAGGVFRDAWGGTRFDTASGVFTTDALVDRLIGELARYRPTNPDTPRLARTVSVPIGTPEEQVLDPWRAFGVRPMQSMSARVPVTNAAPLILDIVDERAAELAKPLVGVTTDGAARPVSRSARNPFVETAGITEATLAFLQALTPDQRRRATFDMDAVEWRMWINVHMNHFRHGVMLEDLSPAVRRLALGILQATLSARGYDQARSIMRLNELLAELTSDRQAFGEWPYFLSVFGTPGSDAPWGWQLDGHHLCVNVVVFDGRIVMTPTFMGAEPRRVNSGPYAGISLFDPEEAYGLDLIRSMSAAQQAQALTYPSIHPDDIPPSLQNLFDGRMAGGAFHDNLVAPYQGIAGRDLSDAQRAVLVSLAATYTGWAADDHAAVRLSEVESHLDETWFSWYGGFDDHAPFYYRVHSPVILIEFDHHPGVALDNEVPSRFHVHTVVRTPNGGDYGADLLRRHHEEFDHAHGDHRPRHA